MPPKTRRTKPPVDDTPDDREALNDGYRLSIEFKVNDETVAVLYPDRRDDDTKSGTFKSGAVGWFEGGKVGISGYNHQLSMSLVQVGTKQT